MRLPLIALTTFAVLVAPSVAAGEDCLDRPAFSPPSGSRLPPYPTIFVRTPRANTTLLQVESPHLLTDLTKWSQPSRLQRVDLLVAGGTTRLAVADTTRRIYLGDYEVGEYAPGFTTITGVSRRHRTLEITGHGNPIALRFVWDDGRETLAPTDQHHDGFVAYLGNVPCFDWNISEEWLEEMHTFVLYALYADGSQERIGVSKLRLDERVVELPMNLVQIDGRIAPQAASPASPLPPTNTTIIQRAPWPGWSGALGGFAVLLGAACLRRRRRGHDHDPRYR